MQQAWLDALSLSGQSARVLFVAHPLSPEKLFCVSQTIYLRVRLFLGQNAFAQNGQPDRMFNKVQKFCSLSSEYQVTIETNLLGMKIDLSWLRRCFQNILIIGMQFIGFSA
jgi:hypothetical protein